MSEYAITPEPPPDERAAIVEALERLAAEDDAPTEWEQHARRESID